MSANDILFVTLCFRTNFILLTNRFSNDIHPPLLYQLFQPNPFAASCIKLPPVQIPKLDGDPLAFHAWIYIFEASVHDNRSISRTQGITYLQNLVSGKAKDLIRGYSCNPASNNVALAELESRFGSLQHLVTANIRCLQSWQKISSLNHTLVKFSHF